jgi:hypothetical protein
MAVSYVRFTMVNESSAGTKSGYNLYFEPVTGIEPASFSV